MCTLTYIPLQNNVFLTHNRDEHALRTPALPPMEYILFGKKVRFPKDGKAGGSWVALSENYAICLLNGAREKHAHRPPYRKSRGLVLLDFFENEDPVNFSKTYNFSGIEPFTLIMLHNDSGIAYEMYWDETNCSLNKVEKAAKIWSSTTLYDEKSREQRIISFQSFMKDFPAPDANQVLEFHLQKNSGNRANDFMMERENGLKTLSITQISTAGRKMEYTDFLNSEN